MLAVISCGTFILVKVEEMQTMVSCQNLVAISRLFHDTSSIRNSKISCLFQRLKGNRLVQISAL